MTDWINGISVGWWSWMWAMLWQVSLLVLLVWGVDRLIRRRVWPQVRYALWLAVLIKLAIPPAFALPTGLTQGLGTWARELGAAGLSRVGWTVASDEGEPPSARGEAAARAGASLNDGALDGVQAGDMAPRHREDYRVAEAAPYSQAEAADASLVAAQANSETAQETQTARQGEIATPGWRVWVMLGWLTGAALLTALLIGRYRGLGRAHRSAARVEALPPRFAAAVERAAAQVKLGRRWRRTLRVAICEDETGPAVYGLRRPVLLLPAATAAMDDESLNHVLLHELAHIRRGDLLAHAATLTLLILYWFNPLLWLVRRRLTHLRELCCDATVAAALGEQSGRYAQTLCVAARRMLERRPQPALGLLGLFESPAELTARLAWLDRRSWRRRRLTRLAAAAAAVFMLACVLPMAEGATSNRIAITNAGPDVIEVTQAGSSPKIRLGAGGTGYFDIENAAGPAGVRVKTGQSVEVANTGSKTIAIQYADQAGAAHKITLGQSGTAFVDRKTPFTINRDLTVRLYTEPSAASETAATSRREQATSRIEGRVIDADTGEGVAGIELRAQPFPNHQFVPVNVRQTHLAAVSEADGRFVFENLTEGSWALTTLDDFSASPIWLSPLAILELAPGETLSKVIYGVQRAHPVEVLVTDMHDTPLSGAAVRLWHHVKTPPVPESGQSAASRGNSRVLMATTDENGLARLALPAGQVAVPGVSCEGYLPTLLSHKLDFAAIVKNTVKADQTTRVTVQLRPLPQTLAVVVDDEGNPVANAKILNWHGRDLGFTDDKGQFKPVRDIFELSYANPNEVILLLVRHPSRRLGAIVKVTPSDSGFEIRLQPTTSLTGTVFDAAGEPMADATVSLTIWNDNYGSSASRFNVTTDLQGRYRMDSLPRWDRYNVSATATNHGRDSKDVNTAHSETDSIELPPMQLLVADQHVAGQVVSEEGNPVAGAIVYAQGSKQRFRQTKTDAEGRFSIEGLCAGAVSIDGHHNGIYGDQQAQAGQEDVKLVLRNHVITKTDRAEKDPNAPADTDF